MLAQARLCPLLLRVGGHRQAHGAGTQAVRHPGGWADRQGGCPPV